MLLKTAIDPLNPRNPMTLLSPFLYYFARISNSDVEDVKNWDATSLLSLVATIAADDIWLDVSDDIMSNWDDFAFIDYKILALFTYLGINYAGDALDVSTSFVSDLKEW